MGATIDSLTRDFSWAVTDALQEYAAVRSGVPCPASLLKNAASARQAFPGSVLRLRDGSVQVVDFTGGVKGIPNGVCGQIRQPTEEAVLRQVRVDSHAVVLL